VKKTVQGWEFNDWDGTSRLQVQRDQWDKTIEVDKDGLVEFEHSVPSDYYSRSTVSARLCVPIEVLAELLRQSGYEVSERRMVSEPPKENG
jgi:hypothetical protein